MTISKIIEWSATILLTIATVFRAVGGFEMYDLVFTGLGLLAWMIAGINLKNNPLILTNGIGLIIILFGLISRLF